MIKNSYITNNELLVKENSIRNDFTKIIESFMGKYREQALNLKFTFCYLYKNRISSQRKKGEYRLCIKLLISPISLSHSEAKKKHLLRESIIVIYKKNESIKGNSLIPKKYSIILLNHFLNTQLKKAKKKPPELVSRESVGDLCKCIFFPNYFYKEKYRGIKVKLILELICFLLSLIVLILIINNRIDYYKENPNSISPFWG